MIKRMQAYIGIFVLVFSTSYILTVYFGKEGIISLSVASMFVLLGLDLAYLSINRYLKARKKKS